MVVADNGGRLCRDGRRWKRDAFVPRLLKTLYTLPDRDGSGTILLDSPPFCRGPKQIYEREDISARLKAGAHRRSALVAERKSRPTRPAGQGCASCTRAGRHADYSCVFFLLSFGIIHTHLFIAGMPSSASYNVNPSDIGSPYQKRRFIHIPEGLFKYYESAFSPRFYMHADAHQNYSRRLHDSHGPDAGNRESLGYRGQQPTPVELSRRVRHGLLRDAFILLMYSCQRRAEFLH